MQAFDSNNSDLGSFSMAVNVQELPHCVLPVAVRTRIN